MDCRDAVVSLVIGLAVISLVCLAAAGNTNKLDAAQSSGCLVGVESMVGSIRVTNVACTTNVDCVTISSATLVALTLDMRQAART